MDCNTITLRIYEPMENSSNMANFLTTIDELPDIVSKISGSLLDVLIEICDKEYSINDSCTEPYYRENPMTKKIDIGIRTIIKLRKPECGGIDIVFDKAHKSINDDTAIKMVKDKLIELKGHKPKKRSTKKGSNK